MAPMRVNPSMVLGEPWAPPAGAEGRRPEPAGAAFCDLEHLISDGSTCGSTVREPVLASAPYLEREGMLRIRSRATVESLRSFAATWRAALKHGSGRGGVADLDRPQWGDGGTDPTDPNRSVDPPDPGSGFVPVIVELQSRGASER